MEANLHIDHPASLPIVEALDDAELKTVPLKTAVAQPLRTLSSSAVRTRTEVRELA